MPTPFSLQAARRSVVALLAWSAVAVDFHGDPWQYFSYFTILTNLSIGLWFALAAWQPARWEKAASLRLALTIYGLVTLVVYWVLLSPTHHPQGWTYAANLVLHLIVPLAMAVEDVVAPWPPLKVKPVFWVLVPPLAYCAASVFRGELTGWYPYFFLNQKELGGWGGLVLYVVVLLAVFTLLALGWRGLVVRRYRRRERKRPTRDRRG